jgi:dienelactone hydrolase
MLPPLRRALFLVIAIAAAGYAADTYPAPPATTAAPAPIDEPRRALFAYDRAADFALEEKNPETRGDATVRDVSFVAVPGEKPKRIPAYIVTPKNSATRAAMLWVHWLGNPATTNRTEFLDEAIALASRGVVSVLPDCMWSKPRWYRDRVLEDDYENSVAQVIAIRRALDLLAQQPGAATLPVGLVGHDYGGMYSTIALGLEPRVKAAVLIAVTASLNDWAFFAQQPAAQDAYLKQNAPLELRDYLAALSGTSVLFQFAEKDRFVSLENAQQSFAAVSAAKQMIVYGGAEHAMIAPATIRSDRAAWLMRELGLEK